MDYSYTAYLTVGDKHYYNYASFTDYSKDWSDESKDLIVPSHVVIHQNIESKSNVPTTNSSEYTFKLYDLLLWDKVNNKEVVAIYNTSYKGYETKIGYNDTNIMVCDLNDRTTSISTPSKNMLPIGICVIPTNTIKESPKARFRSLQYMAAPITSMSYADAEHSEAYNIYTGYSETSTCYFGFPSYFDSVNGSSINFGNSMLGNNGYSITYGIYNHYKSMTSYIAEYTAYAMLLGNPEIQNFPSIMLIPFYYCGGATNYEEVTILKQQYLHKWYLPTAGELTTSIKLATDIYTLTKIIEDIYDNRHCTSYTADGLVSSSVYSANSKNYYICCYNNHDDILFTNNITKQLSETQYNSIAFLQR